MKRRIGADFVIFWQVFQIEFQKNAIVGHSGATQFGVALYIGLSVHKHSCDSDCYLYFDGPKAILRCTKKDATYSTKVVFFFAVKAGKVDFRKKSIFLDFYILDCTSFFYFEITRILIQNLCGRFFS